MTLCVAPAWGQAQINISNLINSGHAIASSDADEALRIVVVGGHRLDPVLNIDLSGLREDMAKHIVALQQLVVPEPATLSFIALVGLFFRPRLRRSLPSVLHTRNT